LIALGIPVLMAFSYGWHERKFFTNVKLSVYAAAAAGSLGLVSFLIYSELRFDQWNIYFAYVTRGWTPGTEGVIQLNPVAILEKFRWPEHLSGQVVNFVFLFMLPVIAGLAFITRKDQGKQHSVVLTALCMIVLYYYFYSSLGNSVGAGITNLVRHLLPTMGIAAILLIAARPRKPEWLSNGLLVSFIVAFLAVEFYFQKQLLDLFRYGYWVS